MDSIAVKAERAYGSRVMHDSPSAQLHMKRASRRQCFEAGYRAACVDQGVASECPNPFCEDGMVTCGGGFTTNKYWVVCRTCRGTGLASRY